MLENIYLALKEIRANKIEVFMTTLGIIVGIAAVTLILALGEGVTKMVKSQIASYHEDVMVLSYSPDKKKSSSSMSAFRGESDSPLAGFMGMISDLAQQKRTEKEGDWLLPFDIEQTKVSFLKSPFIESLIFFGRSPYKADFFDKPLSLTLNFSENTFPKYIKDTIIMGRGFTSAEEREKRHVAVLKLKQKDYQTYLKNGGVLGQYITVEDQSFRVIGLIEGSKTELFIPYTFFEELATLDDNYQYLVKLKAGQGFDEKVKHVLAWTPHFVLNGDFYQQDSNISLFREVLKYLPRFTILMSVVAGISLLVGGIGIMNSMVSSVIKRTKEIGIRKSIGAKKRVMIFQFMTETVIITGIGGVLGILLGVGISTVALKLFNIPPVFPVMSIAYGGNICVGYWDCVRHYSCC